MTSAHMNILIRGLAEAKQMGPETIPTNRERSSRLARAGEKPSFQPFIA